MAPGIEARLEASLRAALDHAIAYRGDVGNRPIPPQITPAEAAARLGGPLNRGPRDPVAVIDDMVAAIEPGLNGMTSPRFFGFVTGGSHLAGVAGEVLTAAWGQNANYAVTTPGVTAVENATCRWVIDLLGLPADSGAGLVTGATLANTVGIMAARSALLRHANWDVEADGLFGAPEIQVVIGAEAHSSPFAALRYAGLGSKRVHKVAVDDQGRIRVDAFRAVMAGLKGPILVVLQAGHINSGAFDPFADLIPIAHAQGAWVHVDGAFGLWVQAVPELRGRLAGVAMADSWAVDLHKWLSAPYDSGVVIVRNRADLEQAMAAPAAYLPGSSEIWNPADSVMELSRRARGVASYAILRTLGQDGVRSLIARHCAMAARVATAVAKVEGLAVMHEPWANQVAFTCGDGAAGDALTHKLLAAIHARGRCYPSHGVWKGRSIIRVSISGCATGDADIDELLGEIGACWRDVRRDVRWG